MATSPPASPPPASNSENSATHHTPPIPTKLFDGANNDSLSNAVDEKPELSQFQILDSLEYIDKYKKYESDYTHRLMAKYFSKKNLYGGNVFDEKMTIEDETIMSSRWPSTRSFADPTKGFEEQSSIGSTSTSES